MMSYKQFTPALVAATALVAVVAFAVPAGASGSYSPKLHGHRATTKVASDATRFAPTVSAKKVTPIVEASKSPSNSYRTYTRTGTVTRRTAIRTSSTSAATTTRSSASELSQARSILAGLIAKYPILAGVTVSFGDARGYQAISYYRSGRIVISSTHTATLYRILNHEVWHIIDYRDNGTIDWGENVPPRS